MGDTSQASSFECRVQEFITLDDKIKRINHEARGLRANKNILEDSISSHMLHSEPNAHGAIPVKVVKKKRVTNSFTKSNVHDCASRLFGADGAQTLLKQIEDLKETTETHVIKRVKANK
ncbi:unnamed protein product [Ectocarpus sp. 6 AP-2014]